MCHAMPVTGTAEPVAMAMIESEKSGYIAHHISTCIPPSEPPAMERRCEMPR